MSFEAYQVGVRLTLINHVSSGLSAITQGLTHANREVGGVNKGLAEMAGKLESLKRGGLIGGALLGVGALGLSLFKGPIDAAREYELAFTKFKTLNLGDVINKQADQFARSANLMGVSGKELMQTMHESVGLFGGFDRAKKMAPLLAQLNQANSAIFGGKIDRLDEGSIRSLMQFIDRRGGTNDDATVMRHLNVAQKLVTGSGGFINFKDLGAFSQQAGTAFRGLSDEGVMNMALVMQEQGGARAGTAFMSLYQNLIAGRTPAKTMALLQDFGLAKVSMETHGAVGGKKSKSMVLKDLAGGDLLRANPPEWFRTVFLPALANKGVTSEADILKTTNDLISNRTGSSQGSILSTQLLQVIREAKLTKGAMDAPETIKAWQNDPNSKFANLHARWEETLRELGLVVLPLAVRAVEGLTTVLKGVINFAREFPLVTKGLVGMFGILSTAAAAGGAIMLAKVAFGGLALVLGGGFGGLAVVAVAAAAGITAITYELSGLRKVLGREGVKFTPETASRLKDPAVQAQLAELDGGRSPFVRNGGSKPVQVSTTVNMDGKKVASIVSMHQAREANKPQSGSSMFDPNMGLAPKTLLSSF
jgi:hypothetical protein